MRLPGSRDIEALYHSELRRKASNRAEDNSQKCEKSRCLGDKCLPCHAGLSDIKCISGNSSE